MFGFSEKSDVIEWIKNLSLQTKVICFSMVVICLMGITLLIQRNEDNATSAEQTDSVEALLSESSEASSTLSSEKPSSDPETTVSENESQPPHSALENKALVVDIKGAVDQPGVYEFQSGDRVADAVKAAGGLTKDAENQQVNQAKLLEDQMMIYVPEKGEKTFQPAIQAERTAESASNTVTPVNINEAAASELITLNGIGEVRAQSIIQYREENGGFKAIEEIKNVSGIGEKIFESLKNEIMVE